MKYLEGSVIMAKMIPDLSPATIENEGERAFYEAAARLPDDYTVLYSYKYLSEFAEQVDELVREADFIIVHPDLGYMVVEVKQGDIGFVEGLWVKFFDSNNFDYVPLQKNPVEQAKKAMYQILHQYQDKRKTKHFPLSIRFALAFPDCLKIKGILPKEINENSIFLYNDLDNLEEKILKLFGDRKSEKKEIDFLINKVLSPSFRVFSSLEDKIVMFHQTAEKILTEEQERILEETEFDKRKIFLGAAGTGKTFLAMEKARRLAQENKRVFLTCFNRNLALLFKNQLPPGVAYGNFHDYLLERLEKAEHYIPIPETPEERNTFWQETLPTMSFDYFSSLSADEKFDAIIVDEGQDFQEDWFTCLEAMLKEDGEFYIFADLNQNLFGSDLDTLTKFEISKHKLTINLRNTRQINKWISNFIAGKELRTWLPSGLPVQRFVWSSPEEERQLIEKEVGRLISQGVQPKRITILSPNIKAKSSLKGVERIKDWPLVDLKKENPGPNSIRFATIRSFKGLEADIVFLIGIRPNTPVCSDADLYVGGSRARFLLYIFHSENWQI